MKPIILADNRYLDAAPTVTSTAAGEFDILNIRDLRTYTWWRAAAAGTIYITVDCATAKAADCLGIIGHNLFTADADVSVESSSDNAAWIERLTPFTPTSDRAILKPFTNVTARYWRIKIVTAGTAAQIAVVMLGKRIEFPITPERGAPFSEAVEVEVNDSKTGNPLGANVRFFPVEVAVQFSDIDRTWVDTYYRPFRENYARWQKFFFWGWDLDTYPNQVLYLKDPSKYDPTVEILAYYEKLKLQFKGVMEP